MFLIGQCLEKQGPATIYIGLEPIKNLFPF
jgi:hypothetical protein